MAGAVRLCSRAVGPDQDHQQGSRSNVAGLLSPQMPKGDIDLGWPLPRGLHSYGLHSYGVMAYIVMAPATWPPGMQTRQSSQLVSQPVLLNSVSFVSNQSAPAKTVNRVAAAMLQVCLAPQTPLRRRGHNYISASPRDGRKLPRCAAAVDALVEGLVRPAAVDEP